MAYRLRTCASRTAAQALLPVMRRQVEQGSHNETLCGYHLPIVNQKTPTYVLARVLQM